MNVLYNILALKAAFWLQLKKPSGTDPIEGGKDIVEGTKENVGETINKVTEIINPKNIFTVIFVIVITWLSIKALNWIYKYLSNRFNRYRLYILRIKPIINVIIWFVAIYSLLVTLFDLTIEKVWPILASSALALGFAAQDLLKNIFGGLMIIFDRPFQIGDRILIREKYGEVVNIGMRNTTINTLDDSMVTIPNSVIISEAVSNANSGALDCMAVVNIWLPINIKVEQVRKIAYEAAITSKYLNLDKPVKVLFFDHFDNEPATNVKIKAYVLDARYEKDFEGDVTESTKKALGESGIYTT